MIVGKHTSEYELRILGTSGFLSGTAGGTAITDSTFNFYSAANRNQWYYVAYVFNDAANFHALYRNGVVAASGANSGTVSNQATEFWIGRDPQLNSATFFGRLDEVRILSRALQTSEVAGDYNDLR